MKTYSLEEVRAMGVPAYHSRGFWHDALGPGRLLAEQQQWGEAWIDSGYICAKEDGTPYHPEVVSRYFRQAVREAKLPTIRPHDLRHTHATLALRAGIHPKIVSERLGHATVSITLDTYSHAIPAMQEEAAVRIAELVSGATQPEGL